MSVILDIGCARTSTYNMRKPFKFFPAYLQKRCRRYLWNVCEEMTVTLEAVKL